MKKGIIKNLKSNLGNQENLSEQTIPLSKKYNTNGLEKEDKELKKLGFFDNTDKLFSENQKFHIDINSNWSDSVQVIFYLGSLYNIGGQNMEKVIERLNSMLEKDLNGTRIGGNEIMENTFQMFLGKGVSAGNVFDFLSKDGFLKFNEGDYLI